MLQKLPIMVYGIAPILCLLYLTLCYSKITYAINNIQLNTPFFYVQSSRVYKSPVTLTYSINCDLPHDSEIKALNKIIIIIFSGV